MSLSYCGAACESCQLKHTCNGCVRSRGCPFGEACFIAEFYNRGEKEQYLDLKKQLLADFNSLQIPGMPEVTELYALQGAYINLEYPTPAGSIKLLRDNGIYLGNQLPNQMGRFYGIVSDGRFLLVCEYGENGSNPEIVLYKRR